MRQKIKQKDILEILQNLDTPSTPHMHAYDHHHGSNQKVWVNLMCLGWHLQCLLTV